MDVDHGNKRNAVFPNALALFNNPFNDKERNAKSQVDSYFSAYTNRNGNWSLFCVYNCIQTDNLSLDFLLFLY